MAELGGGHRIKGMMRGMLAALAISMLSSGFSIAETPAQRLAQNQPSLARTALLETLNATMADGPNAPVVTMLAVAGLSEAVDLAAYGGEADPVWATAPDAAPEVQAMNLRLALTMLSQAYGADDVSDVLDAQPSPNHSALVIRQGTATLSDLRRILRELRLQPVADNGPLTLTVPLVIWAGAAVRLEKGDVLNLSRPHGVFVMNFGLLQMDQAQIIGIGETNIESPVFMPFVTTADGGVIQAQGARFSGLGFGRTQKFSGVSIMQGTIRSPRQASWVHNSVFDGIMTVSVSMARDVTLKGNHFSNMRGAALKVSRAMHAQILLNMFSGRMRTNAIIVEDGSTNARIAGNVVLGGKRTGIVVRADSTGAQVLHNIVWDRVGGGIAVIGSDCGVVANNLVIGNGQKGVEIRSSNDAAVNGNSIFDNHSAGLWVSAQKGDAITFVRNNVLAENGAGVSAAAGAAILMEGNDFSHQFQQFLSGDLATQTSHMARDIRGKAAIVLTAGGPLVPSILAAACDG